MGCPICGANCRCKKRGASGLCCGCHRHKPSAAKLEAWSRVSQTVSAEMWQSYEKHKEWLLESENVKTVGEAMAKKKDLRMGRESGSWRPFKWTERRRREYTAHMLGHAYQELAWWVGEFQAGLLIAELRRDIAEVTSVEMLELANIPRLGVS